MLVSITIHCSELDHVKNTSIKPHPLLHKERISKIVNYNRKNEYQVYWQSYGQAYQRNYYVERSLDKFIHRLSLYYNPLFWLSNGLRFLNHKMT